VSRASLHHLSCAAAFTTQALDRGLSFVCLFGPHALPLARSWREPPGPLLQTGENARAVLDADSESSNEELRRSSEPSETAQPSKTDKVLMQLIIS